MQFASPQPVETRYRMAEGLFAQGDDYFIQSDTGKHVLMIDGRSIRESDTVRLQDLQGNDLCRFQPRLKSVPDSVVITDAHGRTLATVRRQQITPIRDQFTVALSGEQLLEIQGMVAEHEYVMNGRSAVVATVSKRWFRARDSYGVEIAPGQFDACILAAVIALDQMVVASTRRETE